MNNSYSRTIRFDLSIGIVLDDKTQYVLSLREKDNTGNRYY